jgi:hypothetical protein
LGAHFQQPLTPTGQVGGVKAEFCIHYSVGGLCHVAREALTHRHFDSTGPTKGK